MELARRRRGPCAKPYTSYSKICAEFLSSNKCVVFLLSSVLAICSGDWCSYDTGYTTISDGRGNRHSVFISVKRDGSVWARLGADRMSQDWVYTDETTNKFQTTIVDQDSMAFLRAVDYKKHCVVSDLVLKVRAENGWHPSYLNVFDPVTKETKIVSFKIRQQCWTQTNFSLSPDKQRLLCDGGRVNTCGLRNLPERRHLSDSIFLQMVKLDPMGPDHDSICSGEDSRNMYSFRGSYYHVYVKLAECSAPWESRAFGHEAKLRALEDRHENTIIVPDPKQLSLSDGVVKGWQVYNKVVSIEHEVYLQVWRPVREHENMYSLVGQTFYKPQELRLHEVVLSPDQYIRIRKGDVLGLQFTQYNPIAWSTVPCASMMQRFRYIEGPSDVAVGISKQFAAAQGDFQSCRQYSFTAVFANKSNAKLIDDWVCPSPYEKHWRTGELNKGDGDIDFSDNHNSGIDPDKGDGDSASTNYSSIIPLHLILIIAACLILMLIIIGFISYYRAVKS